jgi:thioredoxin 1
MISILYFKSSWCNPCKALTPLLTEVVSSLQNIPLITVDIDEKPEMALQYNVMGVPTMIVVKDGAEAFRKSGLVTKQALTEILSQFADKQVLNG